MALFDIDGTLIRTGGAGVIAFGRAFESEFGLKDATRGLDFAGRTDSSIVREGLEAHGLVYGPGPGKRFFGAYLKWLKRLLNECEGAACPGAAEFLSALQELSNPPLLGLLTGNVRGGAELKLSHYGLWDRFEFGAFGDDHEDRNELARIAQKRAGDILGNVPAGDEILVVGDTPRDVMCANAIGARVLAVATGRHSVEELSACRPTWTASTLERVSARDVCDSMSA